MQSIRPENLISPHRSTIPTFFEEGERYSNEEERCKETPEGFQDEEVKIYTSYHHKARRMNEEEISLLLFQTLKSIEENLKGFEEKKKNKSYKETSPKETKENVNLVTLGKRSTFPLSAAKELASRE